MTRLIENMVSNPADWTMAAISIISAIVAIIACIYSRKSFLLYTEQLKEMKCQFKDTQRLHIMPTLQVKRISDPTEINGSDYVLIYEDEHLYADALRLDIYCQISNVGNGIAKNISYKWEHKSCSRSSHITSLPVGDTRTINIRFEANPLGNNVSLPTAVIRYNDLSGRLYEQKVRFPLDIRHKSISLINVSITAPTEI